MRQSLQIGVAMLGLCGCVRDTGFDPRGDEVALIGSWQVAGGCASRGIDTVRLVFEHADFLWSYRQFGADCSEGGFNLSCSLCLPTPPSESMPENHDAEPACSDEQFLSLCDVDLDRDTFRVHWSAFSRTDEVLQRLGSFDLETDIEDDEGGRWPIVELDGVRFE